MNGRLSPRQAIHKRKFLKPTVSREAREVQRQQQNEQHKAQDAALIITRCIRSVAGRRAALKALRKDWDKLSGMSNASSFNEPQGPATEEDLLVLGWTFLRFYNQETDQERLAHLAKLLLPNTSTAKPEPVGISGSLADSNLIRSNVAVEVLRRLIWICVERIVGSHTGSVDNKSCHRQEEAISKALYMSGPEIRLIMAYIDLKQHINDTAVRSRIVNLQGWLVEKGIFTLLSSGIMERILPIMVRRAKRKSKEVLNDDAKLERSAKLWVNAVIAITSTIVDTHIGNGTNGFPIKQQDTSVNSYIRLGRFICHVLSTPLLLSFVDMQCIRLFNQRDTLDRIGRHVSDGQMGELLTIMHGEELLFLTGNLVELLRRIVRDDSTAQRTDTAVEVIKAITVLLNSCKQYVSPKASKSVTYHPIFKVRIKLSKVINWFKNKLTQTSGTVAEGFLD